MRKNSIIFFLILLSACFEADLQRSIYLPDDEFPELPKYSEWGYNTFGAFVDRQPFVSNDAETPIKVVAEPGRTSFRFTGQRGLFNYGTGEPFAISFVFPDLQPETYDHLILLHNSSWDLASEDTDVILTEGVTRDTLEVLNGNLKFKRAQYLLVDQKAEQVILSGVFEFQAIRNGIPITVSNGRFDVGVADHNFYRY